MAKKKEKAEKFAIKLPAKHAARIIDAYADATGYQETLATGDGDGPNPMTRSEYTELRLREHVQQMVVQYEGQRAMADKVDSASKELGEAFANL